MHQHRSHLHLLDGIESAHTDVCVRESCLAFRNLGQHLVGVGASEHRKLPHRPVSVGVVSAGGRGHDSVVAVIQGQGILGRGEFDARGPAQITNKSTYNN
jgi:hypothetical protein